MFQLFLLVLVCLSHAQTMGQGGQNQSLYEFAQEVTRLCQDCHQSLRWIQQHPDLVESFQNLRTVTFLIPDDSSMRFINQNIGGMSRDQMVNFMKLHVIMGYVPLLQDGMSLITLGGVPLSVKIQGGQIVLNSEAKVVGPFKQLSNGNGFYVIHKMEQQPGQQPGQQNMQNSRGTIQTELTTQPPQQQQEIWEVLQSRPEARKFLDVVNRVGDLKSQLYSNQKNRTFFIPVNPAITSLPYNLSNLNQTVIWKLLMFYIIPRDVTQLSDNQILPTLLQGDFISVKKQGGECIGILVL
eukprot:TRINITY_DN809_c0_g1_i2.p1 TRINITY_DN809_c0_g1~~TRINITY_DN809_c0_g1_i2.p1  ORF type:complete len:296 (-),score=65.24 TRINITY_DN809_c0_g1_i2:304-1191(-)